MKQTILFLYFLLLLASCNQTAPTAQTSDYLLRFGNDTSDIYGYKNTNGDIVIPVDKYAKCFTDTFKTYAIVAMPDSYVIVAIDRQEKVLYKVFFYDNGPDYVVDGLFRITENNKIGYADAATGAIVIKPQFECASPFEEGVAQVSNICTTQTDGEHSRWVSDNWFYIDKKGKEVGQPAALIEKLK